MPGNSPETEQLRSENTKLRAALATSNGGCVYCQLPADRMAGCKSGFPGCARADDMMGCPELGAVMELSRIRETCKSALSALLIGHTTFAVARLQEVVCDPEQRSTTTPS